jgi:hypothetical protein
MGSTVPELIVIAPGIVTVTRDAALLGQFGGLAQIVMR